MKRIFVSILTIAIVAVVGFAVTRAFFSDTETSEENTITAGTIDISVNENNPWSEPVTISDMKPSYVRWTKHVVRNVGNNPLKLWKHIKDVTTSNNGWSESECSEADGTWDPPSDCIDPETTLDNIDEFIEYDMYIGGTVDGNESNNWLGGQNTGGQVVSSETSGIKMANLESALGI